MSSTATPISGWLEKRGHFNPMMRTRWFSVEGATLIYAKDSTCIQVLGRIPLADVSVTALEHRYGRWEFALTVPVSSRTSRVHAHYELASSDEYNARTWIRTIVQA